MVAGGHKKEKEKIIEQLDRDDHTGRKRKISNMASSRILARYLLLQGPLLTAAPSIITYRSRNKENKELSYLLVGIPESVTSRLSSVT